MYEKALESGKIDTYYNAFLFPSEQKEIRKIGYIKVELFCRQSISLIELPVNELYNDFLKNIKINEEKLGKLRDLIEKSS
ncbi:hypothetical protein M2142_000767 [Fusobacterium sp. PH5-29]